MGSSSNIWSEALRMHAVQTFCVVVLAKDWITLQAERRSLRLSRVDEFCCDRTDARAGIGRGATFLRCGLGELAGHVSPMGFPAWQKARTVFPLSGPSLRSGGRI